jgi:hypothetical protein
LWLTITQQLSNLVTNFVTKYFVVTSLKHKKALFLG